MKRRTLIASLAAALTAAATPAAANRKRSDPPRIESSWDDLLEGITTPEDWREHKQVLHQRYLDLLRDQHKPEKPARDLQVHESVKVDGAYERRLISYNVEADERAHAYLGLPLERSGAAPEIVPNLVEGGRAAVLKPGSLRESSKPFTTKENRREETISHSGFREATASQPQRPHPPAQPKLPTHAALG